MNTFDKALSAVLDWEGTITNDPRDPGGLTKYGISKRAYPDLDIASLTIENVAGTAVTYFLALNPMDSPRNGFVMMQNPGIV